MFTNWLTNSVPTKTAATTAAVAGCSGMDETATAATTAVSAAALAAAANSTSSLMSTPPDVVLEVGPPPSVRFVAHSIVLGMHSGYLRSAIRLDEHIAAAHSASPTATPASTELVLYVGNVTAEQFAPLLTYMYTGYLELNVDNIFVVLLATHVLHMPRALEICRSFLARAQSEGYLGNNLPPLAAPCNSGKIIRPIPSKATLPNFGFIAPPMAHHLALPPTPAAVPFKNMPQHVAYQPLAATTHTLAAPTESAAKAADEHAVSVVANPDNDADDDDDEEVFIDTNDDSVASPEIDCNVSVASSKDVEIEKEVLDVVDAAELSKQVAATQQTNTSAAPKPPPNARSLAKREKLRQSRSNKQSRRQKSPAATGGLQVAKAPILASELDMERTVTAVLAVESSKFIVDVASCDGPVRFRRILNTAYGHKPEGSMYANVLPTERTQQSVSLSFHQQMAKTISQQRQLQHAEESENSESSGSGGAGAGTAAGSSKSSSGMAAKAGNNEIYVCVYCKHSFKSQYCYQKHAKRHLNPLSLNCSKTLEPGGNAKEGATSCESTAYRQSTSAASYTTRLPPQPAAAAAELLRREVRPLDMNVQYYPCKTCGSKFPSYYFVHKHRKLCHADEEAQESETRRSTGGSAGNAGGTQKKLD